MSFDQDIMDKPISKIWILVLMGIVFVVSFLIYAEFARAANLGGASAYVLKAGEKWGTDSKSVQGEVLSIGSQKIVLEFNKTKTASKEIHLLLADEEDMVFSHLRGIKDISPGDIVSVTYKDKFVETDEGKYTQYKRRASRIALVKRGTGGNSFVSREMGSKR